MSEINAPQIGFHDVPSQLLDALGEIRQGVCLGHVTPDADSLGAMLGVCRAINTDGRQRLRALIAKDSLSSRLKFMAELAECPLASSDHLRTADALVVVDTARIKRCSVGPDADENWRSGKTLINIDHHVSNTDYGDVNWVVAASSSCELVFSVLAAAGLPIDEVTASLLYAGIYTDTVGFSLPSVTDVTFRTAAELARLGANVGLIGEHLSRSLSPGEFRLLRTVLENTHLVAENRVAYSSISHQELVATGCSAASIDEQVAVPRSLMGIEVAILFSEGVPGRVRVNFRGERGVNVLRLAQQFGGGGHHTAAGAILHCNLDQAVDQVIAATVSYLNGSPAETAATQPTNQ